MNILVDTESACLSYAAIIMATILAVNLSPHLLNGSGSALVSINEVNLRRSRLVLGWVSVSGFNSRCGAFISVCDKSLRSTQPVHPFVGRRNEYQPKGGDALRLGSKGRCGSCVGDR